MQLALTLDDFYARPEGRYRRGRSWAVACGHAGLYATFLAGSPDEDEVRDLIRSYRGPLAARESHVALFDASRLARTDSSALGAMFAIFAEHVAEITRNTTRIAVAHGVGVAGAFVAGGPSLLPIACPWQMFTEPRSALAWLGAGPEITDSLLALADAVASEPPELGTLRAALEASPGMSTTEAARVLGLSTRSLQRRLQAEGTSFQRELDHVRWRLATRELLETRHELGAIATSLGFSSLQAFTDWFTARAKMPPSVWRREHRGRSDSRT